MLNADLGVGCGSNNSGCANGGCERAPDFCIKKNDTMPPLKIAVSDCDGVVDLTAEGLVLEASMWIDAKLKMAIDETTTVISLADNIGFNQIAIGDLIIVDRPRSPEHLLILDIDENEKLILVERGYNSTTPSDWPKGNKLRIFKFIDSPAEIESVFEEISQIDGSNQTELVETFMVFNWQVAHTSLAGCYWLEFKLMMVSEGGDVVWTKRMPLADNGFLISVIDSATPNS